MRIALEPVESVRITTLIDNVSDLSLVDQGPAKRFPLAAHRRDLPAAFLEGGVTYDALQAEHSFSALVTFTRAERRHTLLFDAGLTPDGVSANMARMELTPKDAEAVVLSHGHWDHTTGLDGIVRTLGRTNLPVIIHPHFWRQRRIALPGREPYELPTTSKSALRGAGFEIVEEEQPSFLFERSLLVTGEVERTSGFERGFPPQEAWLDGGRQADPLVLDDQAIILHVREKGLVVLTGCGHAGIVNIVRYARRLTGVETVYAILGGFHLGGPIFEPVIGPTCAALAEIAPRVIVPAHCTGTRATHRLAALFPDAFIQNSVGTHFDL